MSFQARALETAVYPREKLAQGVTYCALGLAGEAGEVANKVKKMLRDDNGIVTDERHGMIVDELGDVLWYVAALCEELHVDMGVVAMRCLQKLAKRKEENTLKGDGDKR